LINALTTRAVLYTGSWTHCQWRHVASWLTIVETAVSCHQSVGSDSIFASQQLVYVMSFCWSLCCQWSLIVVAVSRLIDLFASATMSSTYLVS